MNLSKGMVPKYLLIAVACFACYANTIRNGYAYDDAVVITENRFTQKGIRGIPDIFANNTFAGSYEGVPTVPRYRPLSLATFAIEHQVFGQNPHASHLNNVLLYVLTALVLHRFLRKVFGSGVSGDCGGKGFFDGPLLAVLLFVVHPIHTETVANIKGRDEILALAGSLSGTLLVLEYLDSHKLRHLMLSFCLFLVALFSKENAITFLAVVPLTIFYFRKESGTSYLYSLLPLLMACAIFLGVRGLALGAPGRPPPVDIITEPFAYSSRPEKLATVAYTFGMYIKLLFFPYPLTIDYYPYHIRPVSWSNPVVWLSVLAYTALVLYALRKLRNRSAVSYGILFYVTTFSIVSNVPFSVGTFMSERFMFMPSLGFVIAVVALLSHRAFPLNRYRSPLVLAVSLVCSLGTYGRNRVWRNDFTLFTTDVRTSGNSIKANIVASVTLLLASNQVSDRTLSDQYRADALKYSRKAVSIYEAHLDPAHRAGASYSNAVMLLGDCYGAVGMLGDALRCYKKILRVATDQDVLRNAIDRTISKSSDVDFKLRSYLEFVHLEPDDFGFNYWLGYLYGKEKNELVKAVRYLGKAVEIDPNNIDALRALSHAYKLSKDYERALFYLKRVVELSPGNVSDLERLRELNGLAGNQAREEAATKRTEELGDRRNE
jgi:tetratricopeptide (TPR) repeat protein